MPEGGGPNWPESSQQTGGEGEDQSGRKGARTSTITTDSTVCSCSSKSLSSRSTASTRSSSRSSRSSSLSSKASDQGAPSSLVGHQHHLDNYQYCYCSSTSNLLAANHKGGERHLTWATTSTAATTAAAAAEQEALEEEAQLVKSRASFTARAALRQLFARIGLRRGRLGGRLDPYTSFLSSNSAGQRGAGASGSSSAASRFLPVLRNLKLQRGVSAVASSRHEPSTMSFLFRLVQYVLLFDYYPTFSFSVSLSPNSIFSHHHHLHFLSFYLVQSYTILCSCPPFLPVVASFSSYSFS